MVLHKLHIKPYLGFSVNSPAGFRSRHSGHKNPGFRIALRIADSVPTPYVTCVAISLLIIHYSGVSSLAARALQKNTEAIVMLNAPFWFLFCLLT